MRFGFVRGKNDLVELYSIELLISDQTGDCPSFENLTLMSNDVHSCDDTFSQPQWLMLLRLSPQMKLLGGRGGLMMSQNSIPEMNQRTWMSLVEHPLVWCLAILTNEVTIDGEDSMWSDPGHETSCCWIWMNPQMSSKSEFDCPDLTIQSFMKPLNSSLTLMWVRGTDLSGQWKIFAYLILKCFIRPEWPSHWRTLWVNPLTMMNCLRALIPTWFAESSGTMTAPHIDVEVSMKVRTLRFWTEPGTL